MKATKYKIREVKTAKGKSEFDCMTAIVDFYDKDGNLIHTNQFTSSAQPNPVKGYTRKKIMGDMIDRYTKRYNWDFSGVPDDWTDPTLETSDSNDPRGILQDLGLKELVGKEYGNV